MYTDELTTQEQDELDAAARCPRCGMLEGGTFCQYECGGGLSPEQQAQEAAEYDATAAYDDVRERYAGEVLTYDPAEDEELRQLNKVEPPARLTTAEAEATATVINVTMDEARALPGMLGRIAPAMLERHGAYTCMLDNQPTKYVLRKLHAGTFEDPHVLGPDGTCSDCTYFANRGEA